MGFEVDAKRRRRWGSGGWHAFGNSGKKVVSAVLPIRIICEPPSHHVTEPPVPFKVTGAELYLATFKGEGPVPTQGTSCKVLKVTARFNTTTSGLVHFDLSRKVGDQPLATISITIEAKKKQDGTYAAEYVKDWFLDKPANAQFFVQEIDGQGLSAGWKDINITCDNNLADPTSQPPSDEPTLKVLKSTFSVTTFQQFCDGLPGERGSRRRIHHQQTGRHTVQGHRHRWVCLELLDQGGREIRSAAVGRRSGPVRQHLPSQVPAHDSSREVDRCAVWPRGAQRRCRA